MEHRRHCACQNTPNRHPGRFSSVKGELGSVANADALLLLSGDTAETRPSEKAWSSKWVRLFNLRGVTNPPVLIELLV